MAPITGQTNDVTQNAVFGTNDATAAPSGPGVQGAGVFGLTVSPGAAGVFGANNSTKGVGVQGNGPESGLSGFSDQGAGLTAHSNHSNAVQAFAHDPNGNAVLAINDATSAPTVSDGSPHGTGILAVTNVPGSAGVFGSNNSAKGVGVQGNGPESGIRGFSDSGSGATMQSNKGSGLIATSGRGHGLDAFSDNDVAVFAQGGTFAGVFNGALIVNPGPNPKDSSIAPSNINGSIVINQGNLFVNKGDIILGNADCAEDFTVSSDSPVVPGTVLVLGGDGDLCECSTPYDKRVAGVVSGAGSYKPALVLDRQTGLENRVPIALMGKVYCKVDAQYGAIEIGDLLTTSATAGYAMRATDSTKAFGAVIGKALHRLEEGQGLVPILITLQ